MDFRTVLAVVSMVVAAVSAFYAYQIGSQRTLNELTNKVSALESATDQIRTDDELRSFFNSEGFAQGGVTIETVRSEVAEFSVFPAGAVVAFDGGQYEVKVAEDASQNGCPPGWVRFKQGEGRFIVGSDADVEQEGEYLLRDIGGAREYRLTPGQMPEHTHGVRDEGHSHQEPWVSGNVRPDGTLGWGGSRGDHGRTSTGTQTSNIAIETTGEGKPYSVMPPFIALYLCKKQ